MATTAEEFLIDHNRLSPLNLQATKELLVRFRSEKESLFKDDDWSVEKIRRPFVIWLSTLPDKSATRRPKTKGWVTFPRPAD